MPFPRHCIAVRGPTVIFLVILESYGTLFKFKDRGGGGKKLLRLTFFRGKLIVS